MYKYDPPLIPILHTPSTTSPFSSTHPSSSSSCSASNSLPLSSSSLSPLLPSPPLPPHRSVPSLPFLRSPTHSLCSQPMSITSTGVGKPTQIGEPLTVQPFLFNSPSSSPLHQILVNTPPHHPRTLLIERSCVNLLQAQPSVLPDPTINQ